MRETQPTRCPDCRTTAGTAGTRFVASGCGARYVFFNGEYRLQKPCQGKRATPVGSIAELVCAMRLGLRPVAVLS